VSDNTTSVIATNLSPAFLDALSGVVGADQVIVDVDAQRRFLKDFHWYSPLLSDALAEKTADAVVRPGSLDELKEIVTLAVQHRVAITFRGAGTGNYGQSRPLEGGLLIDNRRLNRVVAVGETSITVECGAVMEDAEIAANQRDRELRVMPSTYHIATAAGFVAGGSGGIGSVNFGRLWDGNVLSLQLLTAEDPPQLIQLEGKAAEVALHTYGTVGAITTVEFPLVGRRHWRDAYATFPSLDAAIDFGWSVATRGSIVKRLVSIQEAPIPIMFEPVKEFFTPTESAVLLILDEDSVPSVAELASTGAGRFFDTWPARPAINQFVFSHSVLWAKHYQPDYTWLQARFANTHAEFRRQVTRIKERFGSKWLHHIELAWTGEGDGITPGAIPVLTDADPETLDAMIEFCGSIGMHVQNPHSYVVREGGMVADIDSVIAFKRRSDPFGLLNPGKMDRTFYSSPARRA
jgi:FAD/FMN-containing dehydrogenase